MRNWIGRLWCWRHGHDFKRRKGGYYRCRCGLYMWHSTQYEWTVANGRDHLAIKRYANMVKRALLVRLRKVVFK